MSGPSRRSELSNAFRACYPWFGIVAVFSAIVNILYLTGSIYMLQVYDRVLSSRSVATLVALSLIVVAAFVLQGLLDSLRGRMLARIGARFDEVMSPRIFHLVATLPLRGSRGAEAQAPVRDLDQIRGFLSGLGPTALFDMPFLPLFLVVTFILHPWLGWLTVGGAAIIVLLTLMAETRSQEPAKALAEIGARRQMFVESTRRNAEAVAALGMREAFLARFRTLGEKHVAQTLRASDVVGSLGAFAKVFRQILQSAAIGLGAYLAIHGEISAGAIIAASILTSRALAPIETAVAHWRSFVAARHSYHRLDRFLTSMPAEPPRLSLPAPHKTVTVEDILVCAPGVERPILLGISLHLKAGDAIGIIGPTGGGKSTLARSLVGVWPVLKGRVRIDGAALDQWGDTLGQHVGYLPQDVEMFDGTVAENIARFAPEPDAEKVIAAARAAGAHDMILAMPKGYDTQIGEGGAALSGGQRQRVALARALYGDPFLVVLDEPNANLDNEGDEALNHAIRSLRERGAVVAVVTHRPSGLAAVNLVAVVRDGRIVSLGPRDEVLATLVQAVPTPVARPAA